MYQIGDWYSERNDQERALAYYSQAFEKRSTIPQDRIPLEHENLYMNIAASMAVVYDIQGEDERAQQYLSKALVICNALSDKDEGALSGLLPDVHEETVWLYDFLAHKYSKKDRAERAIECLSKALEVCQTHLRDYHPDHSTIMADVYFHMGDVYERAGNFERALDCLSDAQNFESKAEFKRLWKYSIEPRCSETEFGQAFNKIGYMSCRMGDNNRAIDSYSSALEFYDGFGHWFDQPDTMMATARTHLSMASTYATSGEVQKAAECISKTNELCEELEHHVESSDMAHMFNDVTSCYELLANKSESNAKAYLAKAKKHSAKAVSIIKLLIAEDQLCPSWDIASLGDVCAKRGAHDAALTLFTMSLKRLQEELQFKVDVRSGFYDWLSLDNDRSTAASILCRMSEVHRNSGSMAEAAECAHKAHAVCLNVLGPESERTKAAAELKTKALASNKE